MKRILTVITTAFVPTGGLAGVVMNYYRQIDKSDLVIDIASTNEPPQILINELLQNGSHYYRLGRRAMILSYYFRLRRLCKGYDIIHVNGNSATTVIEHMAAKSAGIQKRINHNHTSIPDHKLLSNCLYPLFNRLVTERLACSDLAGNWLYGKGCFRILRNAVDVAKYRYSEQNRKEIRQSFGIEEGCTVLGHVGKIYKPKNHPYLIRIFAEYKKFNPNTKLLLIGDGIMRQAVERLVDTLGVRDDVIFAGMRTDIPDMLQAMDFFVFPSLWEGMPLAVLEALSSGLTCVISDHISNDMMIGENIHSLKIEADPKVWAQYIADYNLPDRNVACRRSADAITEAGFNIKTESVKLRDLYLN